MKRLPVRGSNIIRAAFVAAATGSAALTTIAPAAAVPFSLEPIDCNGVQNNLLCETGKNLIDPADPDGGFGGEVLMSFQRQGLSEVATFKNTSSAAGNCHYDAQDVLGILPGKTDDFPLGANSTVTRTYPAPPPFSTYHASVTCNGTYVGIPVQYGNASQDVSG